MEIVKLGFGKWVKVLSQCEAFSSESFGFETVSFLVLTEQVVNVLTKSKCNKMCFSSKQNKKRKEEKKNVLKHWVC